MSARTDPDALARARAATREALELDTLVAWLGEHASTPLGRAAFAALPETEDAALADARRRRGAEALDACRAQSEPSLAGVQPLSP
ncbi:MAG: hypothetical protein ACYTF3_10170, partial [Planctomycetota bacterium]